MSTQITTAFSQQFATNVQLLSQQTGSILRGGVSEESVTGEKAFFDQVGAAAAVKRTSRHGDTPLVDTPHSRRMVTMDSYEWADLIDDADKVRMLIDPTSTYARAAAAAMGRAMDDAIIEAATGTAKTGKSGEINTFMGFQFHVSTRLAKSGNIRTCFAWAEDGIKMAMGKDVMSRIEERADKSYSTQVYYCATFGATRMEEEKVVQIDCDESA